MLVGNRHDEAVEPACFQLAAQRVKARLVGVHQHGQRVRLDSVIRQT
jgi:hypothetical protein